MPEPAAVPKPFSAIELRQISAHIATQWFLPVDDDRLTLMEIDPWRVHAYWNLAESELAAARARLPGGGDDALLALRFTDLSPHTGDAAPPHPRFDVEVQLARNNWYVGLWRDAKHYVAEFGLRAPDGTFVGLLRSNEVVTPRAGPSPELDFRHLEVRSPRALPAQSSVGDRRRNEGLLRDLFPRRVIPEGEYPLAVAETTAMPLEEPPFPSLAPEGDAAPAPDALSRSGDLASGAVAGAGDESNDFPVVAAEEIDPYRALARRAQREALAGVGAALPPVAEDAVAPAGLDLEPQPLPVPPAPVPLVPMAWARGGAEEWPHASGGELAPAAGGAPEVWPAIPLEAVLAGAVSSPGQGEAPVQAVVELYIEGRNASPSPLTLCGDPVPLTGDGSFSIRLRVEPGTELAELIRRLCSHRHDGGGR